MSCVLNQMHFSPGISDIPNEILKEILVRLSTTDLLYVCRLVSRLWRLTSLPISRHRYVCLKFRRDENGRQTLSKSFYDIFKDEENIPWSSCTFGVWEEKVAEDLDRPMIRKFLCRFGPLLRRVSIGGDDAHTSILIPLMSQMPNLEELTFGSEMDDEFLLEQTVGILPSTFQLRKLKRIIMNMYGAAQVNFLRFLLTNAGAPVAWIHLVVHVVGDSLEDQVHYSTELIRNLVTLIAFVPSISLKFLTNFEVSCEIMRVFTTKHLCITELEICFEEIETQSEDLPFRVFEDFLMSISSHVQRIKLTNLGSCRISTTRIRLPFLSTLKHLEVSLSLESESIYIYNPDFHFALSPLISCQFPVLEKMKLHNFSEIETERIFGEVSIL